MEEDSLEMMSRECAITFIQEEKLKKCGFALESEEDSSPPGSVQVTGIVMVSLPESNEDDVFHTPPELHQSQSITDQPEKTQVVMEDDNKAFDLGMDSLVLGNSELDKNVDSDALVFSERNGADLSVNVTERKDSDNLVFSQMCVVKKIDVPCEPDLSKSNMDRTVDLGRDSDVLVFSGMNVVDKFDNDPDLSKVDCNLKKHKVLENGSGQSILNECTDYDENMEFTEPIVVESENVEIEETEVTSLAENGGLSVPQQSLDGLKTYIDLLEAAEKILDASTTGTDYLRAAKECGLNFYRPRWWPPEGSDDQFMDII